MSTRENLIVFEKLKPGDRIELTHDVRVGLQTWQTTTVGAVVERSRQRHGFHYQRNHDDKVYSDVIVLRRDDGELTTVTLDEFSVLRKLEQDNHGSSSHTA